MKRIAITIAALTAVATFSLAEPQPAPSAPAPSQNAAKSRCKMDMIKKANSDAAIGVGDLTKLCDQSAKDFVCRRPGAAPESCKITIGALGEINKLYGEIDKKFGEAVAAADKVYEAAIELGAVVKMELAEAELPNGVRMKPLDFGVGPKNGMVAVPADAPADKKLELLKKKQELLMKIVENLEFPKGGKPQLLPGELVKAFYRSLIQLQATLKNGAAEHHIPYDAAALTLDEAMFKQLTQRDEPLRREAAYKIATAKGLGDKEGNDSAMTHFDKSLRNQLAMHIAQVERVVTLVSQGVAGTELLGGRHSMKAFINGRLAAARREAMGGMQLDMKKMGLLTGDLAAMKEQGMSGADREALLSQAFDAAAKNRGLAVESMSGDDKARFVSAKAEFVKSKFSATAKIEEGAAKGFILKQIPEAKGGSGAMAKIGGSASFDEAAQAIADKFINQQIMSGKIDALLESGKVAIQDAAILAPAAMAEGGAGVPIQLGTPAGCAQGPDTDVKGQFKKEAKGKMAQALTDLEAAKGTLVAQMTEKNQQCLESLKKARRAAALKAAIGLKSDAVASAEAECKKNKAEVERQWAEAKSAKDFATAEAEQEEAEKLWSLQDLRDQRASSLIDAYKTEFSKNDAVWPGLMASQKLEPVRSGYEDDANQVGLFLENYRKGKSAAQGPERRKWDDFVMKYRNSNVDLAEYIADDVTKSNKFLELFGKQSQSQASADSQLMINIQ